MAFGLPGYDITPINYSGSDGILFHLKEDMSVFLKLSATTDMAFSSPMEATTQPVQTGQEITDNIQEKPSTIQINGVVVVGYEGAFFLTQNTTVVEDFVATLQRWRTQRQVMRVLCKDGITLENAVCTQFEAKKDKSIKNGLNISLTFQDVNFVAQIGQTTAPNTNANGSKEGAKTKDGATTGKKDVGKSGSKQASPPAQFCQKVKERIGGGQGNTANDDWLIAANYSCDANKRTNLSTGKESYNNAEAAQYAPKSIQNAYGFNPNKG